MMDFLSRVCEKIIDFTFQLLVLFVFLWVVAVPIALIVLSVLLIVA
jgi:hypothetical protein